MATRDQIRDYPLVEGMNTKDDVRISRGMELMQNMTLTKEGTPRKRNGITSITNSILGDGIDPLSAFISAFQLDSYKDELLLNNGNYLYSYSEGLSKWTKKGQGQRFSLSQEIIGDLSKIPTSGIQAGKTGFTSVILGNIEIITYQDNYSDSFAIVRDRVSKSMLKEVQRFATCYARAISFGGKIGVIYGVNTTALSFAEYLPATNLFSAPSSLSITLDGSGFFDVCSFGTGFAVASYDSATNNIKLNSFTSALALITSLDYNPTDTLSKTPGKLQIIYDSSSDKFFLAFVVVVAGEKLCKWSRRSSVFAEVTASTTVITVAVADTAYHISIAINSDKLCYIASLKASGESATRIKCNFIDIAANTVGTATLVAMECGISSKLKLINGTFYFASVYCPKSLTTSPTLTDADFIREGFIFSITAFGSEDSSATKREVFVVSRFNYGNAMESVYSIISSGPMLPDIELVGSDQYEFPFGIRTSSFPNATDVSYSNQVVKIIIKYMDKMIAKPILYNGSMFYPGAIPIVYDGKSVFEYGFLHPPVVVASHKGSGTTPGNGMLFSYIAVYEYVDASGITHYSEPSSIVPFTAGATSVTITTTTLKIGVLRNNCKINIYRSLASRTDVFYKITTDGGLINDPSTQSMTFDDSYIDSSISDNDIWPFPATIIDPQPPHGGISFSIFKNRLLGTMQDIKNKIQYSQEIYESGLGVIESAFSEFFKISSEDSPFPIQDKLEAVSSLDEKIIIFKTNSINALAGDGPDRSGNNDSFSKPIDVSNEVGCANPRSIVKTHMGIFFKSAKGIYLLDRALRVSYIGSPVEIYNDLTITGFFTSQSSHIFVYTTASGVAIAYDYLRGKWSVYSNYSAVDCCNWKGKLAHLKSTGIVHVENENFDDDATFVTQKLTTDWIKLSGIQGFSRIKLINILGKYRSAHSLKVSLAYDYELYNDQVVTYTPESDYNRVSAPTKAQLYAGANTGAYQVQIKPIRQKCQAIKITIEDVVSGGVNGESFELTAMSFLIGVIGGPARLGGAKST